MIARQLPIFLIFIAVVAPAPKLALASSVIESANNGDSMNDDVWEKLVAEVFDKYGNQQSTDESSDADDESANDVESKPAEEREEDNEPQGWWDMLDSIDDEDDNEDDHDIDLEIAITGPELYENISEDAIAFNLGDDILMIVESDDGGRRNYIRRIEEARSERRTRLQRFERRLKSFRIRVLRKGVRKTCSCRTSSLGGCRRCGGKCCHSIGNGTVKCREGSRDSCRRIFGKRSKKQRRSSSD